MKKYSFRLEQVRRVRRIQEEVARAHLLEANNEVLRAQQLIATRMADYERSNTLPVPLTDQAAFAKARHFSELKFRSVLIAREEEAARREQAEAKRIEWAEAAMKVKVLDRLDERKREEFLVEFNRDTDKEIDDIVTGRAAVKQ